MNTDCMAVGKVRIFKCAICGESLEKPGPSLESFSFGKILLNINQLSFRERELIYREFCLIDPCFSNGSYDCNKVMATSCGHLFHSGCIREWFFTRRLDRIKKCPFCNQRTSYDECWVIHAIACDPNEIQYEEDELELEPSKINLHTKQTNINNADDAIMDELQYSDISCDSSSYSSDDDAADEANEDENDDDNTEETQPNNTEGGLTGISSNSTDTNNESNYPPEHDMAHSNITKKKRRVITILEYIHRFNIFYIVLLYFTIQTVCKSYQTRQAEHLEFLENVQDEELSEVEAETFVPLGYRFILQVATAANLIFSYERLTSRWFKT